MFQQPRSCVISSGPGFRSCAGSSKRAYKSCLARTPSEECTLAVFGTHLLFDAPGCLWLIGEYWPEDDIVEKSVLLIPEAYGISEPGSILGRDLLRFPVGEIVGFESVSYDEAIKLTNLPYNEAVWRAAGINVGDAWPTST